MITRIGHVGLRVSDVAHSVDFAERVMGLRESERDGGTSYLTCNSRHHELVLIEGSAPGCDHLAFEVFDPDALTRVRDELDARGIHVLADVALERGIKDAVHLVAPGGFVFEIFYGMATDQPAHYETVGVRPRKFEHITIKSSHKDEMERLLIEVFGLRLSDSSRRSDQLAAGERRAPRGECHQGGGRPVAALRLADGWLGFASPHGRSPHAGRPNVSVGPGSPRHRGQLLLLFRGFRRRDRRVFQRHPADRE